MPSQEEKEMNARFSALLITSLAGLMLSGQALANPRFPEGDWLAAREARSYGWQEEREARKADREQDRKEKRKMIQEENRERGYGYGYERRNPQPGQDDRGRR
jgi:hypothetical protein